MLADNIYIAWIAFQRRQESFKYFFPVDCYYYPIPRCGFLVKLIFYVKNFVKTFFLLRRMRPKIVFVQVPQTPALFAVMLSRFIFGINCIVIADCHNAMFRFPWLNYPGSKLLLRSSNFILVHNYEIYNKAVSLLGAGKIFNVPDAPASFASHIFNDFLEKRFFDAPDFCFVFPASWADDEPIRDLIFAFSMINSARLIITGRPKLHLIQDIDLPENVKIAGYLSNHEFDYLINRCDCIFALTSHDDVQLSVCGEAVGAAKPLICSDTSLLRSMYDDFAVFTLNNPIAFAESVNAVVGNYSSILLRAKSKRDRAFSDWILGNADFIKMIKVE